MPDPTFGLAARARLRAVGRAIRKARGSMSQTELSTRLNVPQTTISRWERGTVDFGLEQLRALEHALEISPGHLFAAGGYIAGREPQEAPLRNEQCDYVDEAIRLIEAAERFAFGITLSNAWHPTDDPDMRTLKWTVVVTEEAPEIDE